MNYYQPRKDNPEYRLACEKVAEDLGLYEKKRTMEKSCDRYILAYLMTQNGCGRVSTGNAIHIDHSTVTYGVKQIKSFLEIKDVAVETRLDYLRRLVNKELLNKKQ